MKDITIYPEHLADMTTAQVEKLPATRLYEVHRNLGELASWVRREQSKVHNAMQRRFEEQIRQAKEESGKDFGTVRFRDGELSIGVTTPKRVIWDQTVLVDLARRIANSGDRIEEYLDVEFSVPEDRFNNWPSSLRDQFEAARTVKPGKVSFELKLKDAE